MNIFGWAIIKKQKVDLLMSQNNWLVEVNSNLRLSLAGAQEENKRLFDHHHKRLTKPRRDKSGKLRNPDGTFAKVKK